MVCIKQKREFFDGLATEWDQLSASSEDDARLQSILRGFPFQKGDTLLDAGCGTGRLVPLLHDTIGENGRLFEIDFSLIMLRMGKEKHDLPRLHFIQADVEMLPFPEGFFDGIVCFSLFPHIADKAAAMDQFRRIIKPGKMLAVFHLCGRNEINDFHSHLQSPVSHDLLPDEEEMQKLFENAGFTDLEIQDIPSLYSVTALSGLS